MFRRFWNDEQASVGSAEIVMIMTIMTIGVVVGMKSFRDSTVTEFADWAQALGNLNQSYSFEGLAIPWGDSTLTTARSFFNDTVDFCDTVNATTAERCIEVGVAPSGEGVGF